MYSLVGGTTGRPSLHLCSTKIRLMSRNPPLATMSRLPGSFPAAAADGPFLSWARFFFTPADPVGLNVLRVLAGLLFLGWLLSFMGRQEEFFGLGGWFDLQAMKDLVADAKTDLFAPIPHGQGQTILREALLVADHNSYHLGQMVTVRRLLGAWDHE